MFCGRLLLFIDFLAAKQGMAEALTTMASGDARSAERMADVLLEGLSTDRQQARQGGADGVLRSALRAR